MEEGGQSRRFSGMIPLFAGLTSGALFCVLYIVTVLWIAPRYEYGWTIFVVVPFASGAVASLLIGPDHYERFANHIQADFWACLAAILGALLLLYEGGVCLLMASPLIFVVSIFGSGLVYGLKRMDRNVSAVFALGMVPVSLVADQVWPALGGTQRVSTEIVVNASPERIWPMLQNLKDLPPPDFWMFKMGVAHPLGARMEGQGLGVRRSCDLSTGAMPERIIEWEPNRRLGFKVLDTPPPMKEWNPVGEVKAAHLKGYFECEAGRFELIPLPGGKTKVVGTSWYHHRFRPAVYWNLWTDKIVREVQWRVMSEIARRAEG